MDELKELQLYVSQLEEENFRLKNSIKALKNNNKSMLQGLTKLQSYVHKLTYCATSNRLCENL